MSNARIERMIREVKSAEVKSAPAEPVFANFLSLLQGLWAKIGTRPASRLSHP